MMSATFTGHQVKGYTIGEQIGQGGHGAVYHAKHDESEQTYAIKVILPEHASDERLIERLRIEAQIIKDLRHPNIVHLHEYWEDADGIWMVMPWVDGGDLRKELEQNGPLALEHLAAILEQVGSALDAAHAAQIVHRDIKPENILQDLNSRVYLTDFGVAKRLGHRAITSIGVVMGSPNYLSPEQIMGYEITPRTDIYGLGITVFELLTGYHPFSQTKSQVQLMMKLVQEPLPPLLELRPDLPATVNDVIQRATEKDAKKRYPSASSLARHFREVADKHEAS